MPRSYKDMVTSRAASLLAPGEAVVEALHVRPRGHVRRAVFSTLIAAAVTLGFSSVLDAGAAVIGGIAGLISFFALEALGKVSRRVHLRPGDKTCAAGLDNETGFLVVTNRRLIFVAVSIFGRSLSSVGEPSATWKPAEVTAIDVIGRSLRVGFRDGSQARPHVRGDGPAFVAAVRAWSRGEETTVSNHEDQVDGRYLVLAPATRLRGMRMRALAVAGAASLITFAVTAPQAGGSNADVYAPSAVASGLIAALCIFGLVRVGRRNQIRIDDAGITLSGRPGNALLRWDELDQVVLVSDIIGVTARSGTPLSLRKDLASRMTQGRAFIPLGRGSRVHEAAELITRARPQLTLLG